jgi:hypothetical protein
VEPIQVWASSGPNGREPGYFQREMPVIGLFDRLQASVEVWVQCGAQWVEAGKAERGGRRVVVGGGVGKWVREEMEGE